MERRRGLLRRRGRPGHARHAFVAAVVAASLRDRPVDAARVYLVGYSNGGKLAYSAACAHPTLFAAVTTYGSVPLTPCRGGPARPFLLAAGRLDPILPFGGAAHGRPPLPPVRTALGWLREQDDCPAPPSTRTVGAATVERWTGCHRDTGVTFVLYPRSGHTWPDSVAGLMWAPFGPSGFTPSGLSTPAPPAPTPPTSGSPRPAPAPPPR